MSLFRITHHTTFRHAAPAAMAWQTVRLQPRAEPGQECVGFALEIAPRPGEVTPQTDFFGNVVHGFMVEEPHRELTIAASSLVRRRAAQLPMEALTPLLPDAVAEVAAAIHGDDFLLAQYVHASPLVPLLPEARALATPLVATDLPALTWIGALGARFAEEFSFERNATSVTTPLAEVLTKRRGVCQDFAHAFASCVRQHGLPAAYVSGYLLTDPPPGKPRLRGADAMHAWVSIFVPGTGWVDYDPTNHVFAGEGHIVVARGRDYSDVSPVRGVFKGGGIHTLHLGVTVEAEEETPPR